MNKTLSAIALAFVGSCLLLSARNSHPGDDWAAGTNVSGIRQDSVSVSGVEFYGKYVGGGFKASFEAESAWKAGAVARTIRHLDKFSMLGAFSFEQMEGEGMKGSMFIRPGFYPVDVIEFTPGHKTLQKYSFTGGISVDIAPEWRFGFRMDFESSNYSKRKDLRHTNYRLDMNVAPGFEFHRGDFAAGLNYVFNKNSETVDAEQIGTGESSYYAFLDKGLYYGKYEVWTGSGVHLDESGVNGFPVKEFMHGLAAQIQWKDLYWDAEFLLRNGSVGEKQFVWFRFPGWQFKSGLHYTLDAETIVHSFRFSTDWLHQNNWETVLERVTRGGVSTTEEYGSNLVYSRSFASFNLDWSCSFGPWCFGADSRNIYRDGVASPMYPEVYGQDMFVYGVALSAGRKIGRMDVRCRTGVSKGTYDDYGKTIESETSPESEVYRLSRYNDGYLEYLNTLKFTVDVSYRYNFANGMYAGADGGFIGAPQASVIAGKSRWAGTLKIGYTF